MDKTQMYLKQLLHIRKLNSEVTFTVLSQTSRRLRAAYEAFIWLGWMLASVPLWILMSPHWAAGLIVLSILAIRLFMYSDREEKIAQAREQIQDMIAIHLATLQQKGEPHDKQ